MVAIKICQGYNYYVDPMCAFACDHIFKGFNDIVQNTFEHVVTKWVPNVNPNNDNLSNRVVVSTIMMHVKVKASNYSNTIPTYLLLSVAPMLIRSW